MSCHENHHLLAVMSPLDHDAIVLNMPPGRHHHPLIRSSSHSAKTYSTRQSVGLLTTSDRMASPVEPIMSRRSSHHRRSIELKPSSSVRSVDGHRRVVEGRPGSRGPSRDPLGPFTLSSLSWLTRPMDHYSQVHSGTQHKATKRTETAASLPRHESLRRRQRVSTDASRHVVSARPPHRLSHDLDSVGSWVQDQDTYSSYSEQDEYLDWSDKFDGSHLPRVPAPPGAPRIPRLPTPELAPLSSHVDFCPCDGDEAEEDRINRIWYLRSKSRVDSQVDAALAHIAQIRLGRGPDRD